uniref:Uncharacterized protein n=1 Tax=Solanum lycopersicum TaxID=4081 RepID=A0A3Q7IVZ4_SOLLC
MIRNMFLSIICIIHCLLFPVAFAPLGCLPLSYCWIYWLIQSYVTTSWSWV